MQIKDNYDVIFDKDVIKQTVTRLTNQIWKLIPMREHNEDWEKQLHAVNLEIAGLGVMFAQFPQFLSLRAKLEGMIIINTKFELFRKTVFECISLLQEVKSYVGNTETKNP